MYWPQCSSALCSDKVVRHTDNMFSAPENLIYSKITRQFDRVRDSDRFVTNIQKTNKTESDIFLSNSRI